MSLTAVICTIPERASLLSRCLWSLTSQPGDCKILVVEGPAGHGDKLRAAVDEVTTTHMTVIDDDDYVLPPLVESVNEAIDRNDPDYVGFRLLTICDDRFMKVAATRGDRAEWSEAVKGPVKKGVTRTDIWRRVPMGNAYSDDRRWHRDVIAHIKSAEFVDRVLYVYDYRPGRSAWDRGARDVGTWPFDADRVRRITP